MADFVVLQRGDDLACDKSIKNKFKWSWLEEKDKNDDFLSSYIRKTDRPGQYKSSINS